MSVPEGQIIKRDFKLRNFRWTPADCNGVSKAKQLASPADVKNKLGFRSTPFMQPWTETSQLQTFTDSWGFIGFT